MKNKNLSGGLFAVGKPQPLTIKETPLSAQIKEYLDNRGIWNERLNSGKIQTMNGNWITLCEKGTPDRIAVFAVRRFLSKQKCSAKSRQTSSSPNIRNSGRVAQSSLSPTITTSLCANFPRFALCWKTSGKEK